MSTICAYRRANTLQNALYYKSVSCTGFWIECISPLWQTSTFAQIVQNLFTEILWKSWPTFLRYSYRWISINIVHISREWYQVFSYELFGNVRLLVICHCTSAGPIKSRICDIVLYLAESTFACELSCHGLVFPLWSPRPLLTSAAGPVPFARRNVWPQIRSRGEEDVWEKRHATRSALMAMLISIPLSSKNNKVEENLSVECRSRTARR